MLIDDDEDLLTVLFEILSVNYECKSFLNAHDALLDIKDSANTYDCIVCDLMMPKMNGIEFYEALRLIQPTWLSRLVFMTGGSYSRQMDEFLQNPEVHYCEKPVQVKAIRSLVEDRIAHQK